ncbi:MAG: LLM class flavin-dependent oxidoreductase [Gammaproteobacteria bacterium]|nr:LLM class flavin-dependent oxidoreductase [Gammaproteobacteria bacterium]
MEVGMIQVIQSWGFEGMSDAQVYEEELKLAINAEELGFDHIWVVEHHFTDYSFCPDNFVYLAYLAAQTERIGLATGAVIVPWNIQPLRVAEKAALLDQLSGGRLILGLGRGLSRREFEQFGIDMEESRDRFDEAAPMILDALESGVMEEHDGKYFKQPRAVIRPKVTKSFKNRITQVAMSPESGQEAAKLGAQMMAFNYKPKEVQKQEYEDYKKAYIEHHGVDPRPMLLSEMIVCDHDASRAAENSKYIANYCLSVLHHYELMGEHYKQAKGYSAYGDAVDAMRAIGKEGMMQAYVDQQIWGTPDQMLRRFEERRKDMGPTGMLGAFRFAGIPFEVAERSQKLFAEEVLPVLKSWDDDAKSEAA